MRLERTGKIHGTARRGQVPPALGLTAGFALCLLAGADSGSRAVAQLSSRTGSGGTGSAVAPHRTRLILKDGSYQVVMSYSVAGSRVRYISAERGGETEEIPLALVDLDATRRWELRHGPAASATSSAAGAAEAGRAPELDPELLREEADRAAMSPEVAPDLHLPPEDSVVALDTFQGMPELVPLAQNTGDINRQTGHNILRAAINPMAVSHQIVTLKGEKAAVQMHVPDPVLFLRLDDAMPGGGASLTVDTHGASSGNAGDTRAGKPSGLSRYVIVRVDVRQDARVVASFNTSALGKMSREEDVVETAVTPLPGGHWVRIAPRQPLLFGEYALVEVLGENQINLSVWDFGVHPTAPENRDLVRPEKRRPAQLERRGRN